MPVRDPLFEISAACARLRGASAVGRPLALLMLLLHALLASTALAATPNEPTPEARTSSLREAMQDGPVAATPLLWRVEPAGGATLHLLGSIHFGPPGGWRLPFVVEDAFAKSRALVVEIDQRNVTEAETQAIMARIAMAPAGSTLADYVSAETLNDLDAYVTARGGSVAGLMPFRPWMVSTVLMIGVIGELGFSAETGIDGTFLAQAGKREVIALETVESQLSIFGDLSPELDALFLRDTLDQVKEAEEMIAGMAQAWRAGDEKRLVELLAESFDEGEELQALRDALIVDRNVAMAKRLDALARDPKRAGQDVFVVVGAAHFVGEDDIRSMLAAKGLRVRTIRTDGGTSDGRSGRGDDDAR